MQASSGSTLSLAAQRRERRGVTAELLMTPITFLPIRCAASPTRSLDIQSAQGRTPRFMSPPRTELVHKPRVQKTQVFGTPAWKRKSHAHHSALPLAVHGKKNGRDFYKPHDSCAPKVRPPALSAAPFYVTFAASRSTRASWANFTSWILGCVDSPYIMPMPRTSVFAQLQKRSTPTAIPSVHHDHNHVS
jgi:hypothetical protein